MADATCSVDPCDAATKARGYCGMHYARVSRHGTPYRPCRTCGADIRGHLADFCSDECRANGAPFRTCVVCGEPHAAKRLNLCSPRCQQLWHRTGGPVPKVAECQRCGSVIDLMATGKAGRKKRADTKMCDWCKRRRHTRHKVSVMDVVNAHGSDCGICGDPVDLTLRAPDLFRASIDHVIPYSRGGTHDISNLQIAHLYCNYLKSDREGFTI